MADDPSSTPAPRSYRPGEQARQARYSGVEASSTRKMSRGRRAWYFFLVQLARVILRVFWSTCRIHKVTGAEHLQGVIDSGKPALIVYWHQMNLFCGYYLVQQIRKGLRLGFLISPSVTGEVPAAIARGWGAEVIRGSATRSGSQTLRDMYDVVAKQGVSLVTAVDGSKGPIHQFKPGSILLARITRAPLLPIAYAAERCKYWNSWDRFIVPYPFSRIAIAIGAPVQVPADLPTDEIPRFQQQMEETMAALIEEAQANFSGR